MATAGVEESVAFCQAVSCTGRLQLGVIPVGFEQEISPSILFPNAGAPLLCMSPCQPI